MSSSYTAIVSKISVRPHPNADRLQLGTCLGNQVVVGLDTKQDQLGVFFPTDGQLGHEYCEHNNLYTASARQRLGLPEGPTGFFDHNRRVRAQRFRGERSDGFWMPLESLSWAGDVSGLKEGDTFTEFGGYTIAQKYYTPATLRALAGQGPKRKDNRCFPKHDDTKQFRFVADQIPDDSVVYITEKLHGTSGRFGFVLDELPLAPWKQWLNTHVFRSYVLKPKTGYAYLNGSKNVILEKTSGAGWYGTNEFRYDVVQNLTLHKGEILYFEIVGWVNESTPVMPPHKVDKTNLKDILQRYGDTIEYTYGCPRGEHRIYIYKIVRVNEDGVAYELPWPQVVSRCRELGIPHVPLLFGPTTLAHLAHIHDCDGHEALRRTVEQLTEGESTLSSAQIREGVVVRVESPAGIGHIKNKQWAFGVLEGFWKEKNEDSVDPEEAA